MYVPDRDAAERAGKALARAGFHSEAGPAADGDDWLLVATHEAVAEKDREVATQEAMREIAIAVRGTYNCYAVRDAAARQCSIRSRLRRRTTRAVVSAQGLASDI